MPKMKTWVSREKLAKPDGSCCGMDGVRTANPGRAKKRTPGSPMGNVHTRQTGGTKGMDSPMGRMDKKTGSRPGSVPKFPKDSGKGMMGNRGPTSTGSGRKSSRGVSKGSPPSLPRQGGRGVKGGGNKAVGKKGGRGKSLKVR